ncbi:MAG: 2-phospho-L-lactate guanylyltransferase [Nocardioidaceae bacterium]
MPIPAAASRFGIVMPMKQRARAKSRLAPLGDRMRRQLVAAFAHDTIGAALGSPLVDTVLVVTDDAEFAGSLRDLGVRVIPDGVEGDLNETLRLGAAEVVRERPELSIAALFADLPALTSADLTTALTAAAYERCFVADADAVGSTLLTAHTLRDFTPAFGGSSRAAHLELGITELTDAPATLRRDVDTPEDLTAALALGVGPHTRMIASAHGL